MNIYFPFWTSFFREWDIKTQNTFSGLEFVHIDISNRCTHSCVFCGLYGPDAVEDTKRRSGGEIPEALKKYMKMEIDSDKCFNIIQSLPWSVKQIQFGGFGDPLMHENAVNFIAAARKRGFQVEMLSNMEYIEDTDVYNLHKLGGKNNFDLHFIANISGGTAENYIKTRPKQTEKHFNKIVHNISLFSQLRKENNNDGVHFTLMCVVNKLNCHNLLEVAELAHKIGAYRIWFKPMEIHAEIQKQIVPSKDLMAGMAKSLAQAIEFSEKHNIEVFQKDYCEQIISKHSTETINV
jgi:wyosine [tRNA(Phe)-imidazoG37] synthetase (radical SAM superfamily)